jgi:ABC-type amino acid transport substrate-binding protein
METLDALAGRVEGLERQNAVLRRAGGAALLALASTLFMAPAPAPREEVRARRLMLVDASGKTRASLSTGADGAVTLVLAGADERPRATLGVSAAGAPALTLHDEGGRGRATLGIDQADTTFLRLSGRADVLPGLAVAIPAAGPRVFSLADAQGRPRLLAAAADEETSLTLRDRGTESAVAVVAAAEDSRLAILDAQGVDRLWAAVRRQSPVLQFFNARRAPTSGLATFNDDAGVAVMSRSTGPSDPGLALFGKKPGVLWSAPN